MDYIVTATAGHVDHGKTTLIKRLTGTDTDTAPEEKKRGLTINLGFAYFDLPSKKRVAFVDVPGHEKFLKNMISGLTGIDMAHVKDVAMNELGMDYASKDQIVTYEESGSDYVRQYTDIPAEQVIVWQEMKK